MYMVKNNSFVIMGCKHCGKSTHGRAIAEKLGLDFFDVDSVIERLAGVPVRQFYAEKGAADFMQTEEFACKRIIDYTNERNKDVIVSTGGGICDNAPALDQLRVCKAFVFLRLNINDMVKRIMEEVEEPEPGKFTNLPAFVAVSKPKTLKEAKNILTEKLTARNATYEKIADIIVDIDDAPIDENTEIIFRAIH